MYRSRTLVISLEAPGVAKAAVCAVTLEFDWLASRCCVPRVGRLIRLVLGSWRVLSVVGLSQVTTHLVVRRVVYGRHGPKLLSSISCLSHRGEL